jgi:hypothetical protein
MTNGEDLVDTLRRFNLFADLDRAQLEAIADPDSERSFAAGERILRRGMSGSGFYVILEGEASVTLGGEELNRLRQGDFFGEISTLLDEPLTADITAETPVRVLEIPGPRLEAFLLSYPKVMLRMLDGCRKSSLGGPRGNAPARRVSGRRRRQWAGSPADGLRALAAGRRARGHLAGRLARWHVPQVADLPAAALLDEAGRAVRTHGARVRVV